MNHEKILEIMKSKNIKNKELAEMTGIPLGTLNKILYGISKDPSVNTVQKIAHALGYKVDDFVDPEPYTPTTIAAHHDGEWTESELDEIARFKEFIRAKREQK